MSKLFSCIYGRYFLWSVLLIVYVPLQIDKETSFVKFRRWWKGVDIFEKTYIFLPIHEK